LHTELMMEKLFILISSTEELWYLKKNSFFVLKCIKWRQLRSKTDLTRESRSNRSVQWDNYLEIGWEYRVVLWFIRVPRRAFSFSLKHSEVGFQENRTHGFSELRTRGNVLFKQRRVIEQSILYRMRRLRTASSLQKAQKSSFATFYEKTTFGLSVK
jgi:hypothetical protein